MGWSTSYTLQFIPGREADFNRYLARIRELARLEDIVVTRFYFINKSSKKEESLPFTESHLFFADQLLVCVEGKMEL